MDKTEVICLVILSVLISGIFGFIIGKNNHTGETCFTTKEIYGAASQFDDLWFENEVCQGELEAGKWREENAFNESKLLQCLEHKNEIFLKLADCEYNKGD